MTKGRPVNPFVVPKRFAPDSLAEEYDRKKFKQWVSDLPVGDVGKLARSLYHEITRHNRLDMSPVERFDAMQLMLPSLAYVLEKLWARFSTKPIPLRQEEGLIARLHLELLVSVVVAYKTVLSQFHDDSFTGYLLHKRARSDAVRYALYFLGEILLHRYALYQASPRFVWKEMHGFYYYAVTNELQRDETESTDLFVGHLAIDDIYKRALLLALANPNSLLRGEAKKVNDALVDWLPQVPIISVADGAALSHPVFVVDATKDAQPYVADSDAIKQIRIGWVLPTDQLGVILEDEMGKAKVKQDEGRPVKLVTVALLSKLHRRWKHGAISREERANGVDTIEAACGLEQLHRLFGGDRFQLGAEDDVAMGFVSGFEIKEEGDDHSVYLVAQDKPIHAIERDEFVIEADAELFAAIAAGSGHAEEQEETEQEGQVAVDENFDDAVVDGEPRGEECACINKSNNGYHLVWPEQCEYKAHVGELVGINSKDNAEWVDSWKMGVIRWMRVQAGGRIGFGIELFAGDVEAVRLDYQPDGEVTTNSMLGFQQTINGKIEAIITRPFFLGDENKFSMSGVAGCTPVVAGEITESTDAFMRFKVSVDVEAEARKESNNSSEAEDLFNSIWDDL